MPGAELTTIFFDMGNVLVHFSHERMCAQIADVCQTTTAEVESLLIDSGLQWNFERGLISPAALHAQVQVKLGREVDAEKLRWAASNIFLLNTPIVPILDQLRQRSIRLILLSNTSIWHFEFIREQFDVLDRFDDYVVSYEVGAIKPEPPIFEAALSQLDGSPDSAFYTDDIPAYVDAGRHFGLQAEVFTGVPELCQHLQDRGVNVRM